MPKFIPVDCEEQDLDFMHVNPNAIVDMRIDYPSDRPDEYDVICKSNADVDIIYTFASVQEARNFIRRVGGID